MGSKTAEARAASMLAALDAGRELIGDAIDPEGAWRSRLAAVAASDPATLCLAVAGTVKSGKSTLANALLGADVLKRGAGIITSLVTRVRPGPELRANIRLKGWQEINREVTDAALFLDAEREGRAWDLRNAADREQLAGILRGLSVDMRGEGGFFDKNMALLQAYLEGYPRVVELLDDTPHRVEFRRDEFDRHRDFSGQDAQAAYVDDLLLEVPGLPLSGDYEIADCQGYDSPNPRHMEKVQEYLVGAHLVVYVVSSRVGLREADLRFLRDIRAMGLLGVTHVVLNADLGEHDSPADLQDLGRRMAAELEAVGDDVPLYTFSALRTLLEQLRGAGAPLGRRDALFLELWSDAQDAADEYGRFRDVLEQQIGAGRERRVAAARNAVLDRAGHTLQLRLTTALRVLGEESEDLASGREELVAAQEQVGQALAGVEAALETVAQRRKKEMQRRLDATFHPAGGELAAEVLGQVKLLERPTASAEAQDRKHLFRQMARLYQEMRAALQRHAVESVNPRAVDAVRRVWTETTEAVAEAAAPPVELLIQSVESYRQEAAVLGLEVPPLELPTLERGIGKRTIPLFSSLLGGHSHGLGEQVLAFAGQWTRTLAGGWTRRLLGKDRRGGVGAALLADAADAVRGLLLEETRSAFLHYNERLKFQVLGQSLDALVEQWRSGYRETVEALVVDLDRLAARVQEEGQRRADLVPRLRQLLDALDDS